MGDIILIEGDKEYVIPTKEDIKTINSINKNDFLDEEEAKKILNV